MDQTAIFRFCKNLGCCDACCLRYIGLRSSNAYENAKAFALKFQESATEIVNNESTSESLTEASTSDDKLSTNGCTSPPAKKRKVNGCVSCLGVLEEAVWPECNRKVKEVLDKKKYECTNFACALSAPIATILREKAITLRLKDAFPDYDPNTVIALKEAWKWSYGRQLAAHVRRALDSGAAAALLVTLHMEYPHDLQELEVLKTISPALFESRSKQKKRFAVEFTRRSVEQALEKATLQSFQALEEWKDAIPTVGASVSCVSVVCAHAPIYLGGRYIKLSRELPQTPWLVNGRRMMESSVQEIIFEPLAKMYEMSPAEAEHRLKFMSAGREDVDVRCLGDGRPFAIEITDPQRELRVEELKKICEEISSGGQVEVNILMPVTKEDLADLKKGEENKCKTYEALCIKLPQHSAARMNGDAIPTVTQDDINSINTYRNTPPDHPARVVITQKTPIRVLHRRPLLTRTRQIIDMKAALVPNHPQLLVISLVTSAGAYVKEFVHGELRRTSPALGRAAAAPLDVLALDVARVHLNWPNKDVSLYNCV